MVFPIELTEQIYRLCNDQSLTHNDIRNRHIIRDEILNFLKPYYPNCEIYIYGSTLNSFGTRISDLDLLFMPYPEYKNENFEKVKAKITDKSCPSVNDVKNGIVSKEALLSMDICNQLNFFRKVLRRNSFQQLIVIPARCPILHFYIKSLNVYCDLSYGSRLVLYNTKLLYFYNTIDCRVRLLTMTLRHWAKSLHFVQPGILSSYAITLLVIFFLQSIDPPIIPSIKKLKSLSDSSECIDGWEVAFTTDIRKIDISENRKSPGELLKDFFSFYWKFDFAKNVVCPYSGNCLPIKELLETDDERLNDFGITSMCIQDPFLLSCNVSRNMNSKVFCLFKQGLLIASTILNDEYNSFELLFDENEYKKLVDQIFYTPLLEAIVSFDSLCTITFLLQTNWKQIWHENICQPILDLLRYGLLIECEVIDKDKNSSRNLETEKEDIKIENGIELLISIQCAVYHRTYVGRTKIKEIPQVNCDSEQFCNKILRDQFVISNFLIQKNVLLSSPEPFFWFYFDCYAHKLDGLVRIDMVLTPLTQCKDTKTAFNFLTSFIPQNINKLLSVNKNSVS